MRRVLSAVGVFALLASAASAQAPARLAAGASVEFSAASVECFDGEASAAAGRCRADDFDLPQVSQPASQGLRVGLTRRDGRTFWFRQSVLRRNAAGLRSLETAAPPVRGSRISDTETHRCEEPLGKVEVADADTVFLGDAEAMAVVRAFARETNCFRVLDRGRALAAHTVEAQAGMASGQGTISRPDYYLVLGTAGAPTSGSPATPETAPAKAAAYLVDTQTTEQLYAGESEAKLTSGGRAGPLGGIRTVIAPAEASTAKSAYREALAALVQEIKASRTSGASSSSMAAGAAASGSTTGAASSTDGPPDGR